MTGRVFLLLLAASLILSIGFLYQSPSTQPPVTAPDYLKTTPSVQDPTDIRFEDHALRFGLYVNHQQTANQLSALSESLGSGVCILDANRDGWMDLFFVGGSGHTRYYGRRSWWHQLTGNRLFINESGLFMHDRTEAWEIDSNHWGMGCAAADLDNDGWTDLLVTGREELLVYRNTGEKFLDRRETSGLVNRQWSTGATLADFNADGLIDIYLTNYLLFAKNSRIFERTKGFEVNTVAFDSTLYDPIPNRLFLNQGSFVFNETTSTAGVANPLGRSLGARALDLNADGKQDLLVINDLGSPNQVFINNGNGRFSRSSDAYPEFEVTNTHDALARDFNQDGEIEILFTRGRGVTPILTTKEGSGFADMSRSSGIADQTQLYHSSWGVAGGDFNNDRFDDLYLAGGTLLPDIDAPLVPQGQADLVFTGQNFGQFRKQAGPGDSYPMSSRGAVSVDINNDGNLEVLVSNNNNPLQVMVNQEKTGQWLGLDLVTENRPEDYLDAVVRVESSSGIQTRGFDLGQGFLSQGDVRLHFGLAGDNEATVNITWGDGSNTKLGNLPANRYLIVRKSGNPAVVEGPVLPLVEMVGTSSTLLAEDDRLLFTRILLSIENPERLVKLNAYWESFTPADRDTLLAWMVEDWHTDFLVFLKAALVSNHTPLKRTAIQHLRTLELEPSIAWLIPLLKHEPAVACDVAQTFEAFFREEEAVTHRKRLAVVPLIRTLDSADPGTVLCAITALAEAERRRAVLPLMQVAGDHPQASVRAAAITALGLLRDRMARSLLQEVVSALDRSPLETARALVALVRLGATDDETARLLGDFYDKATQDQQLRTLTELLNDPDHLVLGRNDVRPKLVELVNQSIRAADVQDAQTRSDLLQAIRLTRNPAHEAFTIAAATDGNPAIRSLAWTTAIELNPGTDIRRLFEEDAPLIAETFRQLQEPIDLSDANIRRLAQLVLRVPGGFPPINETLTRDGRRKLARSLLQTRAGSVVLTQHCHDDAVASALPPLRVASDKGQRYTLLYCKFVHAELLLADPAARIEARGALRELLNDTALADEENLKLLMTAAHGDRFVAENLLFNQIPQLPIEALEDIANLLIDYPPSEKSNSIARQLFDDLANPLKIRLKSALHLARGGDSEILATLESELLQDVSH